jgi:anti-sigma factor RsiW
MDCAEIKGLLSEYLDGVLNPETKNRVDRHLAECHACREDLADLKALVHELGSMEPIQPPEDFLVQVHGRLEKSSRFSRVFRTLFLPFQIKWPLQLAGAVAMAILVFSLVYFQQEEFKAPVATLQEDRGAEGLTAPEDQALETKARSALEQTAPKESQVDARPVEVTLLLREDRMPRAHEPGGAPPAPLEKKETKTARRALQSAKVAKEERRSGVAEED